jgi:AcrR family transcriptional regulator
MTDPVKPNKRRYRSALRDAQARDTRTAILDAARKLFTENGWETPISAIAREASVSKETIYAAFGTKQAILEQLISTVLRGRDAETPLIDQPERLAIFAEADQRQQIRKFAADIAAILARVAPLVDVVRSAARTNPEIADLYSRLHRGRRENLEKLVAAIAGHGLLRAGLDPDAASETVWRLASPELFLLVTRTEGIAQADYADWLAGMLEVSLLAPDTPDQER